MAGDRVVEHHVIEQLGREPRGLPLEWVCDFVRQHGRARPLAVLREMWVAGFIALHDDRARPLLPWECADVWRCGEESRLVFVLATASGVRWTRG